MATDNAIRSFTLDVDELGWTGYDLQPGETLASLSGVSLHDAVPGQELLPDCRFSSWM
jgi:hypothetical protein